MASGNRVEKYLKRIKNHKVLAILIFFGIIIIAIGNVFDAFEKISSFWKNDSTPQPTTINLAQIAVNTNESYFVDSGQNPLIIKPDEYWQIMALATSVISDTLLPKAWPRLRYMMSGSKFSTKLEELATADSVKRKEIESMLNPILDVSFINTGEATALLNRIDFEVSRAEYITGADIVRPGAIALPVLNRYYVTIPNLNIFEGDSTKVISTNILPPIEMRSKEAARIQIQFLHHRGSQFHYEGRLKFYFANAPSILSNQLNLEF